MPTAKPMAVRDRAETRTETRRPGRVRPEHVDIEAFKKRFGGCFPAINGRKYRYPAADDERRWVCLIAQALTWDRVRVWCARIGKDPPPARPKFSYILYHARPDQKKRRSKRNKHRRELGAPPGTEVHHQDQKRLSRKSAIVISEAEHDRIHASDAKKKAKPITFRSTPKPRAPAKRAVRARSSTPRR